MTNDLIIIYDGVDSTSATEAASANSVRVAYEKGVEALGEATEALGKAADALTAANDSKTNSDDALTKANNALQMATQAMAELRHLEIPEIEDSGWLVPVLNSGIKGYSQNYPVKYRKRDGIVEMRGAIAGVTAKQTPIFTLPEGWRPNSRSYKVCATDSGLSYTLELNTDGGVKVLTDATGYSATTYYFIDCVFIPN